MSYEHTDEKRASDPHALPDVEVFEQYGDLSDYGPKEPGFYYAHGFPGCLWDSDPVGPFETYSQALEQAREYAGVYEEKDCTCGNGLVCKSCRNMGETWSL